MYMGGTLLFIGYVFSAHSCSEKDLLKQISSIRVDYRLGVSLPSDYKFWYCTTFTKAETFVITPVIKITYHFILGIQSKESHLNILLLIHFISPLICLLPCSETEATGAAACAHSSKILNKKEKKT